MSSDGHFKAPVHRGAWLVYINGIEIPCPSVSVGYGVGVIPEATISFPPHRLLHRLGTEDRVEVVIFYLDTLYEPENPQFRLLFEGEIIGWSYTSSPHGRNMTFNAVADISIFTQLYYFFLNNVDAITSFTVTPGEADNAASQPGAFYPFSLFKKGLIHRSSIDPNAPPKPDITRPFEILYNAVRGMVDSEIGAGRRAIPSVNFFSRWVRKRNFVNRFAALPLFEDGENPEEGVFPLIQSVQSVTALQTLQQNMGTGIGNSGTMWEVLQGVFSHVLFEVCMLPTAPCARVRVSDGTILGDSQTSPNTARPSTEPLRLINYFVKPQMFFGIAPTCNVMFPSMVSNYSYSESYIAQPTRTYVNDQFFSGVMAQNPIVAGALTFGYPPEVDAVLRAKMGVPTAAKTKDSASPKFASMSGKNMLVFPEEFFKGPVMSRMPVPPWFTHLVTRTPDTAATAAKQSPEAANKEAASLHELMRAYVEYEHFRGRYEKRGGAVNMAWNPYVVPGFPCVVFDQKASAFHTLGYLSNVNQTMSLDGMHTAVNYSMARTIPEMLDLLKNEIGKDGKIYGSAPLEPVEGVRNIIQDFTKAEQFYNALFFQRQPMRGGKKASFDFREVLGYANDHESADRITLEDVVVGSSVAGSTQNVTTTSSGGSSTNVNASTTQSTTSAGETSRTVVSTTATVSDGGVRTTTTRLNTLDGTRDVVPLPGFVPLFQQYATAMQYIARPICTLTEYVAFLHGNKPLAFLAEERDEQGIPQVIAGDQRFGEEVVYYARIRRLRQGPGTAEKEEVGVVTKEDGSVTPFNGAPRGTANDAQTRADWDTALLSYRSEMYSLKGPQE